MALVVLAGEQRGFLVSYLWRPQLVQLASKVCNLEGTVLIDIFLVHVFVIDLIYTFKRIVLMKRYCMFEERHREIKLIFDFC